MRSWWLVGLMACAPSRELAGQAPPPGLTLAATVAGGAVSVNVSGAAPNEAVQIAGSLAGPGAGPCPPALGGECIDLLSPVRVGQWRANAAGLVAFTLPLPPGFPGGWLQAIALRGAGTLDSNTVQVSVSTAQRTVDDLVAGDLVITEILQNPSASSDTTGEWFEVYNPGFSPIDLEGLVVDDLGQDLFTVRGQLLIPAGGYVVFGGSTNPNLNGGAAVDYAWSGFALGNDDDEVILSNAAGVIDQVVYDGGSNWLDPSGEAMTLSSDAYSAVSNDSPGNWCVAVDPLAGGDLGSPGADNIDCGTGTGGGPVNPPVNPGVDIDLDGAGAGTDCDDHDPRTLPGAAEVCDGIDNNCDGSLGPNEADGDGDGLPDCDVCSSLGWRAATQGVNDPALLRAAIEGLVQAQTCTAYDRARDFMFLVLDNRQGYAECVYTGTRVTINGAVPNSNIMNTEHTWPQSQGASAVPEKCDLHHLYPTDSAANGQRGSLPFADVVSGVGWSQGGSERGNDSGGRQVFEPRAAHKGNVARSMLYMHTHYGLALGQGDLAVYKAWHLQDPVDQAELQRSLVIGAEQGAPNPFVVCPDLVSRM